MTLPRIALLLVLAGAVLVLAGALTGQPEYGIEGAYFTRDGESALDGVFNSWSDGTELFSPADGNLWIGGGIACLVLAAGAALAHRAGLRIARRD